MPSPRYALVVEDNATVLLDTVEMLEDAGFDVFASMDTDGAMRKLVAYDDRLLLLFTNVQLPGALDGFELARHAALRWPSLPIIVASGRRTPEGHDLPDGAVFLEKPYTSDDVTAALTGFGLLADAAE